MSNLLPTTLPEQTLETMRERAPRGPYLVLNLSRTLAATRPWRGADTPHGEGLKTSDIEVAVDSHSCASPEYEAKMSYKTSVKFHLTLHSIVAY